MKDLALNYYRGGIGCCQCVLKAAEQEFRLKIDPQTYEMVGALNSGVGIGGMCSVLLACVMVLGLLYGEEGSKPYRIAFLTDFHKKYASIDCNRLMAKRSFGTKCTNLVYDACEILDSVIASGKL